MSTPNTAAPTHWLLGFADEQLSKHAVWTKCPDEEDIRLAEVGSARAGLIVTPIGPAMPATPPGWRFDHLPDPDGDDAIAVHDPDAVAPLVLYVKDPQTAHRSFYRLALALAAAPAGAQGRPLIEWQSGPNLFKDWCAQWFGPDSDNAYLARAVAAFPAGQPTQGELHVESAKSAARIARNYVAAFEGKGIDWHSGESWPHRIELAQALDHMEALSAMVMNLAERVVPPLVVPATPAAASVPAGLRLDYERALDSINGHVAQIKCLEQHNRELTAFKAMVNRHAPEFPADPDAPRDVWYWQGDGEDHLESMVHTLPIVIRAEQLRELLASLCERICAAIKAEDDKSVDEDSYMLTSNDCIAIVRKQFAAAPASAPADKAVGQEGRS